MFGFKVSLVNLTNKFTLYPYMLSSGAGAVLQRKVVIDQVMIFLQNIWNAAIPTQLYLARLKKTTCKNCNNILYPFSSCSFSCCSSILHLPLLSVRGGLVYSEGWDCSDSEESMAAYVEAMAFLRQNMWSHPTSMSAHPLYVCLKPRNKLHYCEQTTCRQVNCWSLENLDKPASAFLGNVTCK